MTILLTGASGFLGSELLCRLLRDYPQEKIHVLLRAASEAEAHQRLHRILELKEVDDARRAQCVPLVGDVVYEDLGLATKYDPIAVEVTEIFHTAANTSFNQKLEDARKVNCQGTVNVATFAERAQQLGGFRRLHHVSTAYVCGNRSGLILEDELECGQDFSNTYEQSKYEAEIYLRAKLTEVPITIYRPSIIVGDSKTGRTQHFYVIYEPMRWFCQGQLSFLPCKPEIRLDIVPVDYVAEAIIAIARRDDSVGKTYHLSAGPQRSLNLRSLVEHCSLVINAYNREHGYQELPAPEIVTPEMIDSFEGEQRDQFRVFFERAWQQMQRHMPYVVSQKDFDDTNTRAALETTGISCPSFSDYLHNVVYYAMSKNFRADEV
ncbi:MAG: SDR family oxidoreductase [Acidobacteriota bacterium]|nr:SDR family oxidoreductase [Blastocatellia bacterium]MDW8411732.1 SDR family oxidoreductase [Acidobacteriota bacterium]